MGNGLYLVGISGPPRSGKDTLAKLVQKHFNNHKTPTQVLSLSLPMRLSVYALMGLEYSEEHYEREKDRPFTNSRGEVTTIRKEMISLSEDHVKPRLGHGWWGFNLLNRVGEHTRLVVVPDMGFDSEREVFDANFTDTLWIHLYRDDKDFSSDSRSYVGDGYKVFNNRTPEMAADRIVGRIDNARWNF